jgi:hypothetical protein
MLYYDIIGGARIDITPELYAAFQANGKASALRLWVPVVAPVPSPTQRLIEVEPVITSTTATQTWQLVDKSTAELEREANEAERAKIDQIIADIEAQRAVTRAVWDAYTANQLRAEQWKDRQVLLRLANLVARQMRSGG